MTARVFVDTNVLVYARDRTDEDKHRQALAWMAVLWEERAGHLSWQVLQEYYVTVTRKLDPPRDSSLAREDVTSLVTWRPIPTDLATIDAAWAVEDRFGLSWRDSLIVAAAQVGGCSHLLSEDLQDGQLLDGVTVIDPFRHTPESIL
ncbi:MAG: PIN domain-containing protein [Gemmatimonadota bacterium]|nr:PIN domain-containing protein [Gemmatimonadota bacterium]